jgi:hypothetical protein
VHQSIDREKEMDSKMAEADKAHAVCIPFPMQSHIKAMLKFAKLLHAKGFHITFVNTEFETIPFTCVYV